MKFLNTFSKATEYKKFIFLAETVGKTDSVAETSTVKKAQESLKKKQALTKAKKSAKNISTSPTALNAMKSEAKKTAPEVRQSLISDAKKIKDKVEHPNMSKIPKKGETKQNKISPEKEKFIKKVLESEVHTPEDKAKRTKELNSRLGNTKPEDLENKFKQSETFDKANKKTGDSVKHYIDSQYPDLNPKEKEALTSRLSTVAKGLTPEELLTEEGQQKLLDGISRLHQYDKAQSKFMKSLTEGKTNEEKIKIQGDISKIESGLKNKNLPPEQQAQEVQRLYKESQALVKQHLKDENIDPKDKEAVKKAKEDLGSLNVSTVDDKGKTLSKDAYKKAVSQAKATRQSYRKSVGSGGSGGGGETFGGGGSFEGMGNVGTGMKGLLNSIAGPESGGRYDIKVRGGKVDLSKSVGELSKTQAAKGKYQIVGPTMKGLIKYMGLTGKEPFTPALQDQMAIALLTRDAGLKKFQSGDFESGKGKFLNGISRIWAGVKGANGKGHYDGDKYGNKAHGKISDDILKQVHSGDKGDDPDKEKSGAETK